MIKKANLGPCFHYYGTRTPLSTVAKDVTVLQVEFVVDSFIGTSSYSKDIQLDCCDIFCIKSFTKKMR
jgi:hypothetical protein